MQAKKWRTVCHGYLLSKVGKLNWQSCRFQIYSSKIWNFKQRQLRSLRKVGKVEYKWSSDEGVSLVNAFALLMVQNTAISFYHHHLFIPSKSTSRSSDHAIRVCLHCVAVILAWIGWLYVLKNHSKEWYFLTLWTKFVPINQRRIATLCFS